MKRTLSLLLVAFTLVGGCGDVSFVEDVTIVNNTEYSAEVDVSDRERESWLGLGFSPPESETTVEQVIDQGDIWVFRFDYVGRYQEELEVDRADLERNDWRVDVPQSFEDRLRELDIPPPP